MLFSFLFISFLLLFFHHLLVSSMSLPSSPFLDLLFQSLSLVLYFLPLFRSMSFYPITCLSCFFISRGAYEGFFRRFSVIGRFANNFWRERPAKPSHRVQTCSCNGRKIRESGRSRYQSTFHCERQIFPARVTQTSKGTVRRDTRLLSDQVPRPKGNHEGGTVERINGTQHPFFKKRTTGVTATDGKCRGRREGLCNEASKENG